MQSVYLPKKFGFNKSRAHLSNLIINGEITRQEALDMLKKENNMYSLEEREKDLQYILKKLDLTENDWNQIMQNPIKTEDDYKNDKLRAEIFKKIKRIIRR